jgi:hypothetical protein
MPLRVFFENYGARTRKNFIPSVGVKV